MENLPTTECGQLFCRLGQPEQPVEPEFPERHAEEDSVEGFQFLERKRQMVPSEAPLISEEFSSFSPSGPANISSRSKANATDVISESILPQSDTELDELPKEDSNAVSKRNLPDLVDPQLVKNRTPQQEMEENNSATPPEATPSNFPANHFENCSPRSSMTPSYSACWDSSSLLKTIFVNSTEPTTSAVPSTEVVQPEVVLPAEKINQNHQQPASSDKDMVVVATLSSEPPTAESESQMVADVVETDKEPRALLPSEKSPKPRKFLARVQGLPETILTVFPDKVLFKHPFDPVEMLEFDCMDKATRWILSLAERTLLGELNGSDPSTTSNSQSGDLNSESSDEVVVECDQNETRPEEETASGSKRAVSLKNSIQPQLRIQRESYQVTTGILTY